MRKIAATYIFPGEGVPLKNGLLLCEDDGTVIDLQEQKDGIREQHGVEFYSGIVVPGFVNTHCHLELSHLHNKLDKNKGIGHFVKQINQTRSYPLELIEKAINAADKKMWSAGIAAVGDIANTSHSLKTKVKSKIHYHTFIESFGFHPSRAERAFQLAQSVLMQFKNEGLSAGIVPHSPYSVSHELFKKIQLWSLQNKAILSIHNQESKAETEFYKYRTGPIADHLQNNLGIDISHWKATGKRSIEAVLDFLPTSNQLLLVHNTFTQKADIEVLKQKREMDNTFLVLCPNSNLFIENQLPPLELFLKEGLTLCLGTDSLASNSSLSVLNEMVTLQNNFPKLSTEELLQWACINGARALGLESTLGSFKKGKQPGVNLIRSFDFSTMKLKSNCSVKRLV